MARDNKKMWLPGSKVLEKREKACNVQLQIAKGVTGNLFPWRCWFPNSQIDLMPDGSIMATEWILTQKKADIEQDLDKPDAPLRGGIVILAEGKYDPKQATADMPEDYPAMEDEAPEPMGYPGEDDIPF